MSEGCKVKVVVIGDETSESLLLNHDLDYTITPYEQHAMFHFKHFQPEIVVFDLVTFDQSNFETIRLNSKTVCLSPIFSGLAKVDMVFHRTHVRAKHWTTMTHHPVMKCGLEYAVISDHCLKIPEAVYKQNLDHDILAVAISMGGADAGNKTLALLNKMKEIPDRLLFWVLLGEGYAHSYQSLVDSVRGSRHEFILAKTNDSMWRILNTCALVILAGGTTTYEAVCAGLPSVNTLETEEHFFLIEELVEKGACAYAGYTFEESTSALRGIITRLNRNRDELLRMHLNTKGLIDTYGAQRIASEITRLYSEAEIEK